MLGSFMVLEYGLAVLGLLLAVKVALVYSQLFEDKFNQERDVAKIQYNNALKEFVANQNNPTAKERCFAAGDRYFYFGLPDYLNYPLPDFGGMADIVDNSSQRKAMIEKDIEAWSRQADQEKESFEHEWPKAA